MKRLAILMLVLALATISNASIQLTINNSTAESAITIGVWGSVQVGIYKDDSTPEGPFIDYEFAADIGSKYNLSNVAVTTNAGNLAGVINLDTVGTAQEYLVTIASSTGLPSIPGQVFNSTVTGMGQFYALTVNLWDTTGTTIVDTTTIWIPEPMTLALLGLGALMLRNKR